MALGSLDKAQMRALSLTSRSQRSSADQLRAGQELAALPWHELVDPSRSEHNLGQSNASHNSQGLVGMSCYMSMAGEPPTSELITLLETRGIRVALPIMKSEHTLAWGWHSAKMVRNSYGVIEPTPDESILIDNLKVMIIPALRAGKNGSRLGRGAGYYDRAMSLIPKHAEGGPLRVAVVFDDELDDTVAHDELDQHVDVIATPSQFYFVAVQS